MANWKVNLELEPNEKGKTHLQVSISYTKGGANYFSGTTNRRGIYVHCTPIKRSADGTSSFLLFDGNKMLLEELAKLNRKKLEAQITDAQRQIEAKDGPVWRLIDHVLTSGGYKLKEGESQAAGPLSLLHAEQAELA